MSNLYYIFNGRGYDGGPQSFNFHVAFNFNQKVRFHFQYFLVCWFIFLYFGQRQTKTRNTVVEVATCKLQHKEKLCNSKSHPNPLLQTKLHLVIIY